MIINTELRDHIENGVKTQQKDLIMSYLNGDGKISSFQYTIPLSDMYVWKYARANDTDIDHDYLSWDNKPVRKDYKKPYIKSNSNRIYEILLALTKQYPQMSCLTELHFPDLAYSDIEVEVDEDGFPEADAALKRVNTISWVHNTDVTVFGLAKLSESQISKIQEDINAHCKKFNSEYKFEYRYYTSETAMLTDFMFNYVKPMTAITGWNFLKYDWKYLVNRCKRLGIDITFISPTGMWTDYSLVNMFNSPVREKVSLPAHKLLFDYMEVYFKWDTSIQPKEGFKLDDVADAALGVKKVQHALGFKDMWEQQPALYVFYNAIDSILVREIDKKLKTSHTFYALANLINCDAMTAFSTVPAVHAVQTQFMYKENKVFPEMRLDKKNSDESYEGAFVYEPIPGAYSNVIALDFASLYPTTMRQFNISPDTYITKDINRPKNEHEIKTCTGATYTKDFEGMLPKILTSYYKQRKVYKKEMQIAIQEKYDLMAILERRKKSAGIQ